MDSMLNAFITESRDSLEVISNCFLALENDPQNANTLDELFRSVHTMKGSSGLFDIVPFTKVVHAAEDVLDQVRDGEVTLTSEHIDLFLDSMDQVSAWLDALEEDAELETNASSISDQLSSQLRAIIGSTGAPMTAEEDMVTVVELTAAPNWLMQLSHEARIGLFRQLQQADQHLLVVAYTPDESCFFNGDDPIRLMQLMPGMETLVLETTTDLPDDLSTLDPFLCQLKCHALSSGDYDTCHNHLKYVSDQCEFFTMDRSFLAVPEGDYAPTDAYKLFIDDVNFSAINADWDKLSRQVNEMASIKANAHYQQNLIEWLAFLATELEPNARVIKALLNALKDGQFVLENSQTVAQKVAADQFTPIQAAMDDLIFTGQESGVLETADAANSATQSGHTTNHVNVHNNSVDSLPNAPSSDFGSDTQASDADWNNDIAHDMVTENTTVQNPDLHWADAIIQVQSLILNQEYPEQVFAGKILSTVQTIKNVCAVLNKDVGDIDAIAQNAIKQNDVSVLLVLLDGMFKPVLDKTVAVCADDSEKQKAPKHQTNPDIAQTLAANTNAQEANPAQPEKVAEKKAKKDTSSMQKTLRVDQYRIDALMDLVGELVVAKNALPFLAKKAEEEFGVKALAKEIQSQYSVINRLSDEMQSAMMQVRMVPLSTVFQRFPRLVRDLSRKLGKNINLVLEGEETEADKNVVEELSDPLIHLVRNSLDHGLETPEERVAKGKSEQGTLTLRAIPHDDQVLIEIVDDGKGIDPDVIKRKAYEKGIIDEQRLDTITDNESLNLIFAAGFSTAEAISDLSGRGVGMDVVRTVIQEAGGTVGIESELGKGTTIRLSLPLSMAVTRIMMIESGTQCYGINMQSIVETVKVPSNTIHRIKQSETLILRGRVVPIFHLHDLLQTHSERKESDELCVLVVMHHGEEIGLVVDEFHEGIDTIQKPLEGIMASYPFYSGTALLGDGRVLLVLNTEELLV